MGSMLVLVFVNANGAGRWSFDYAQGLFAADFYNEYHYRSDFFCDGVLDLMDVGRLATGIGSACQ
jgi:hypothetical protein